MSSVAAASKLWPRLCHASSHTVKERYQNCTLQPCRGLGKLQAVLRLASPSFRIRDYCCLTHTIFKGLLDNSSVSSNGEFCYGECDRVIQGRSRQHLFGGLAAWPMSQTDRVKQGISSQNSFSGLPANVGRLTIARRSQLEGGIRLIEEWRDAFVASLASLSLSEEEEKACKALAMQGGVPLNFPTLACGALGWVCEPLQGLGLVCQKDCVSASSSASHALSRRQD